MLQIIMVIIMNQTIQIKASGRRETSAISFNAIRRIARVIFSERVTVAVAVILLCLMWWDIATIESTVTAGEAVATDCLYAMPWGIVWAIRATLMPMPKEGGEA